MNHHHVHIPQLPQIIKDSKFPKKFTRDEISDSSEEGREFVNKHQGVTFNSNWVIPQRVLMSAYPFPKNFDVKNEDHLDEATDILKKLLLKGKIDVFVNLQAKKERKAYPDYKAFIKKVRKDFQVKYKGKKKTVPKNIYFYDWEIEYMDTCKIEETKRWISELKSLLRKGHNIMLHSKGGNGRVGTICACLLGEVFYQLKFTDIIKYVQAAHSCRGDFRDTFAPQKPKQFLHVADFVGEKRIDDKELVKKFKDNWKDFDFYFGNRTLDLI